MAKTLNEQLKYLKELEQEIRDTVEEIKIEGKNEAMKQVQQLLINENSDQAKKLIDEIEELKNLSLVINTKEINDFVNCMLSMDSEEKRFFNNNSGNQFNVRKTAVKENVREIMKRKGYQFIEVIEGKLKFEKDGDYYYTLEFDSIDENKLEDSLKESAKFCNLVMITNTEMAKKQLKNRIENWLNKTEENEVLKKYLTIQLGSYEHLEGKGTVLEKMQLA